MVHVSVAISLVPLQPKTIIAVSRYDYMLHQQCGSKGEDYSEDTPTFDIKQVEFNTMSVSLKGMYEDPIHTLQK